MRMRSPTSLLAVLLLTTGLLLSVLGLMQGVAPGPSVAWASSTYPTGQLFQVTRDQSILAALQRMPGTSAEKALDHIVKRHARVLFKDLGTLSKQVRDFDALSWISVNGQWVILINEKHRHAPPEALAAVIAHEAVHDDTQNSMSEEISGWHQEADVWMALSADRPDLQSIPAGRFALVDRLNRLKAERELGTLGALVRDNPAYVGLPVTSPGFNVWPTRKTDSVSPPFVTTTHPSHQEHAG